MDQYTAKAWFNNGECLARNEVLHSAAPPTALIDYWPLRIISEWMSLRGQPANNAFKDQLICHRRNKPKSSKDMPVKGGQSNTKYVKLLLKYTSFNHWVLKVQSFPESCVDEIWSKAKQDVEDDHQLLRILEQAEIALPAAISTAFKDVSDIGILLRRLGVLRFRFEHSLIPDEDPDWHQPISINYDFISEVFCLDPKLLGMAMSKQCQSLFRRVVVDDLLEETETSGKLAHAFDSLVQQGRECIAAGLEEQLVRVIKVSSIIRHPTDLLPTTA